MKITFVHPNVRVFSVIPNLGFAHLTAAINAAGHDSSIILANKDRLSEKQMIRAVKKEAPDVVGIQCFTYFFPAAASYARIIKEHFPGTRIIVGGPHPSCAGKSALFEESAIDFAFRGEAELGMVSFLDTLDEGRSDFSDTGGLIWRESESLEDEAVQMNALAPVKNLDTLPHPDWSLMPPDQFPISVYGGFSPGYPVSPLALSRGCNFNCRFCSTKSINGPGTRYFSTDYVISEITSVEERYGVKNFAFIDQNLFQNRELAVELFEKLLVLHSEKNINWYCPNGIRIDSIDDEITALAAEAGCYSVTLGIESADSFTLSSMNKKLELGSLPGALATLDKHGIKTTGNFMYGYPGEAVASMARTMLFSNKLPIDRAQFAVFVPYPGTDYFEILEKENRIPSWEKFKIHRSCFVEGGINSILTRIILVMSFILFYSRPKIMKNLFREIISPLHFLYIVKRTLIVWFGLL